MLTASSSGGRIPISLVLQFWGWAAILRPLKHVMSIRWLVRLVRTRRGPGCNVAREAAILQYMSAKDRFPRRPPANCYERSLAAYRLLGAVGARPELRVGVRRPGVGAIDGHVWVVLDGRPVAEAAGFIEQFTPILTVDADGHFIPLGPHRDRMVERGWTDLHREPTPR
jgi:hypothetical protein